MVTRCSLLLFLVASAGALLGQDVIHLRNGATLEGQVSEEAEGSVTLQFLGGSVQIDRSRIQRIERGVPPTEGARTLATSLDALRVFDDRSDAYFLYHRGLRVGFRSTQLRRTVEGEVPGYLLVDRSVYRNRDGAICLDLRHEEFVDSQLNPKRARSTSVSGPSVRDVTAVFEGAELRLEHRVAGQIRSTSILPAAGLELAGFSLIRPDRAQTEESRSIRTLDLLSLDVVTVRTRIRHDRVLVWGEATDVRIVDRETAAHAAALAVWVDGTGRILRQELSATLVALWAPAEEVAAFGRGEATRSPADLDLTFVSSEAGLSLERPDPSWELEVGRADRALMVSVLQPRLRATVDVFRMPGVSHTMSLEGVAARAQAQMRERSTTFTADALRRTEVSGREALEFASKAQRGDRELISKALVFRDGATAFLAICAAPPDRFDDARSGFDRILGSLRLPRLVGDEVTPAARAFAELASEGQ